VTTIFFTDVSDNRPNFETITRQWRQLGAVVTASGSAVVKYFRDRETKSYLRTLPDYLLDDVGIKRYEIR